MLLTIILIAAGVLALPLAVGTLARVAGYGWTKGVRRAHRDPVKTIAPYERVAPGGGGICVSGHWIQEGAQLCHLGHAYSGPLTRGAGRPGIRQARRRHEDAIRGTTAPLALVPTTEETLSRLSSGGW